MPRMTRLVFLSSVYKELAEHRKAIYEAIHKLDGYRCEAMENFNAREPPPERFCSDTIAKCDLVIFIVGHLYGSCPEGSEQSFTELEYEAAVLQDKNVLVFFADDKFRLPADLLEPDAKREKQRAFRKRLGEKHLARFFITSGELVEGVIIALKHWEESRQMSSRFLNQQSDGLLPNLGTRVFKGCNRVDQSTEFLQFFKKHFDSGRPQVFFIVGDRKDCHESLIDRLIDENITPISKGRWGENCLPPLRLKPRGWPYSAAKRSFVSAQLLTLLFQSLDRSHRAEGESPGAFYELAWKRTGELDSGLQQPVVVIQHTIFLDRWERQCKGLLKWYLSFWSEMPVDELNRRFIIFISLIYPDGQVGRWAEDETAREEFIKNRLADLKGLARPHKNSSPVMVLPELSPVYETDVLEWFAHNELFSQDVRLDQARRIFTDRSGRRTPLRKMSEVETELKRIVNSILQSLDPNERMDYATRE